MKKVFLNLFFSGTLFLSLSGVPAISSLVGHVQEVINAYNALPKVKKALESEKEKVRLKCHEAYPVEQTSDPTVRSYHSSRLKACLDVIGEKPPNPLLGLRGMFTGHRFSM